MGMTPDDLIAREQIRDVVYRYARGVDRRDFALVRGCYHPDATDDHGRFVGNGWEFAERVVGTRADVHHEIGRAHV